MPLINEQTAFTILGNILERDRIIAENKVRKRKRRIPLRVGSRHNRLFVRQAFFNQQSRKIAMNTIRRRGDGFVVRLGGLKRGSLKKVKTRAVAVNSVNKFLDKKLVERLGVSGAKRAKTLFRI